MRARNEKEGDDRGISRRFSQDDIELFEEFLEFMKTRKGMKKEDIIPLSIFNNDKLSPLESVVKFFREKKEYDYKKIGELLKRNFGPIGVTYRNAKAKMAGALDVSSTKNSIPVSIFSEDLTVFESIVVYLIDDCELSFKKVAGYLNRNYRTIWTVYKRAKKKIK